MYDSGKVITGILVFVVLMTAPFWINAGARADFPKLEMPATEKKCVESKDFMLANHMQMLENWRIEAVRDGQRQYVSTDGRTFDKSLTRTCLKCHENKKNFCDRCHAYTSVKPYCWECHVDPKKEIQ